MLLPPNNRRRLPRPLARMFCFADPEPPADPPPGDPPADPPPGDPPGDPPGEPTAWFQDDWRQKYAGDDEKRVARLDRYTSPNAVIDALFAAQEKIRSGDLQAALPEGATDEQLSEWRESRGIPTEPGGYDLTFDDGFVIGDEDRPIIDGLVETMHGVNATPEQVRATVRGAFDVQEQWTAKLEAQDQVQMEETQAALAAEWGPDYKANMNLMRNVLDLLPEDVRGDFMNSRLPDHRGMGNSPSVIKGLAAIGRMLNIGTTYIGGGGGEQQVDSINEELASITAKMGTKAYQNDEKMQARWRELDDAKRRLEAK